MGEHTSAPAMESTQTAPRPPAAKMQPRRRSSLRVKLVFLLISTVLGLGLAEIGARLFSKISHRVPLILTDERAGWRLEPNLHNQLRGMANGSFVISTDAEGHRLTRGPDESSSAGQPSLLMVGDSFIMSTAANDDETCAWILAHQLPLNVVNLGVLGYGTDQELLGLERYLDAHPKDQISDVFVFVATNDFTDVQADYGYLGRNKPLFKVKDGHLDRGQFRLSLSDRLMDLSCFYWLMNSQYAKYFGGAELDPANGVDVVVACLEAMREAVTRRGARFHILTHHLEKFQALPESAWVDFRKRTGAIDITARVRPPNAPDPIAFDGIHWNLAGQQRVAEVIKEQLTAESAGKSGQQP